MLIKQDIFTWHKTGHFHVALTQIEIGLDLNCELPLHFTL